MTKRANLIRDGYEHAAEHVSSILRHSKGVHTLVARPDGSVAVYGARRVKDEDRPHVVGAYTRAVRVEELEDDLLFHLRTLSA